MTREEFMREVALGVARSRPGGNEPNPTDREYGIIEKVYIHHPSIDPVERKRQIAELYVRYGMALIMDMVPRAKLMEEKESELMAARARVKEIQEEIREISEGRSGPMTGWVVLDAEGGE